MQNITYKAVFGILITIILFFGSAYFRKLEQVSSQLVTVQKDILVIQQNMLTRQEVKAMIDNEIELALFRQSNKK